jgi:excisionase family DNA binding protein
MLLAFLCIREEKLMESTQTVSSPLLLLSVPEVAKALGLGRTKVYELIACEGLPVVRFGRAVRVSAASLQRWIEQREKQSAA